MPVPGSAGVLAGSLKAPALGRIYAGGDAALDQILANGGNADLTSGQNMALNDTTVGQSQIFDDAPGAVLLAVLIADFAAQKHNGL